jgi:hypothetical protein
LQLLEKLLDECNQSRLRLHVGVEIPKEFEKDLMCCI